MHISSFFRIFPPPKFLVMKHAGLDISDEAIRCVEYGGSGSNLTLEKYSTIALPPGVVSDGQVVNEAKLGELLAEMDKKIDLSYVKVAVPEEKAYLFQTDVPNADIHTIQQNIEFKLEENVPLSAADAVFYFDFLPAPVTNGTVKASVSVVPRSYIEKNINVLMSSGIFPVAFEVVPKAIARAVIPHGNNETVLIVHVMKKKTGMYIVVGGVVCFTSTIGYGSASAEEGETPFEDVLAREINRVYSFWLSHSNSISPIKRITFVGNNVSAYESSLQNVIVGTSIPVHVANTWQNVFDFDRYIPPIARQDSFEYAVAAGLALNS